MTKVHDELGAALAVLGEGDTNAALEHVLAAWRIVPVPELVALVDAVAEVAVQSEPPLDSGKETSQDRRWYARAATRRPAAFGLLLPAVTVVGVGHARMRIEELGKSRSDPRLSRVLLGWIQRPPFHGGKRRSFCPYVVDVLAAQDDPATAAPIAAMAADRKGTIRVAGKDAFPNIENAHRRLAKLGAPPPLDKAARDTMKKIEGALGAAVRPTPKKKQAEALLADVWASPDDDAPRLVYADALTEAGDPRGELIILQCERAKNGTRASRRESELLRRFGRSWLGAIERVILKDGMVFERGFVSACRYHSKYFKDRELDSAPEWSTVVELDVTHQSRLMSERAFLVQPQLRALRRVSGIQTEDFERIAAHDGKLPWTDVSIDHWPMRSGDLIAVLERAIPSLPLVRGFGLVSSAASPEVIAALVKSPIGRTLERFHAVVQIASFGACWSAIVKAPSIASASFHIRHLTLAFTSETKKLDRLTITFGKEFTREIADATSALGTFAPGAIASLDLVAGTGKIEDKKLCRRDGRYPAPLTTIVREAKRLGVAVGGL